MYRGQSGPRVGRWQTVCGRRTPPAADRSQPGQLQPATAIDAPGVAGRGLDSPVMDERCTRCGAALVEGARFCASCGAAVDGCPACGAAVPSGARFCPACGRVVVIEDERVEERKL